MRRERTLDNAMAQKMIEDKQVTVIGSSPKRIVHANSFLDILNNFDLNELKLPIRFGSRLNVKNVIEEVWNVGMMIEEKELETCSKRITTVEDKLIKVLGALDEDIPVLLRLKSHDSVRQGEDWKEFWLVDVGCPNKDYKTEGEQTISVALVSIACETPILGIIMEPKAEEIVWGSANGTYGYSPSRGYIKKLKIPEFDADGNFRIAICGSGMSYWYQKAVSHFKNPEVLNMNPGAAFIRLVNGGVGMLHLDRADLWTFSAGHAIVSAADGVLWLACTKEAPTYNSIRMANVNLELTAAQKLIIG